MADNTQASEHHMLVQLSSQYESLVRDFGVVCQVEDLAEEDLSPDELLKRLVGLIGGAGLAEHCSIMLLAEDGAYLELRAVASRYATKGYTVGAVEWGGKRFALGEGVAGRVASTAVPVRLADAAAAVDFLPLPDSTIEVRSLMCFPLRYGGDTLGVINLSHGEPEAFDADRENAMALIARRMGNVLGSCLQRAGEVSGGHSDGYAAPASGGVLLTRDQAGRVLQAGENCIQLTGVEAAAWCDGTREWAANVVEEDRQSYEAYLRSVRTLGTTSGVTYRFKMDNGDIRRLHETSMARSSSGEYISWVQDAVVHEVVHRCFATSSASSLLHAQRVHTMGALANGVIHDLNNLLTGIVGNLDLALGSCAGDRVGDLVSRARTASIRGADIVNKVLKFGRAGKRSAEHTTQEVSLLLDEAAAILQCSINPRIQLDVVQPEGRHQVCGDERQLIQALVNLGVNARDAVEQCIPGDDRPANYIRIGAESVHLDGATAGGWASDIEGDFVRFFVSDNGEGMAREVVARIFEPFYSARKGMQHTGLGLPTVKRIVEQHHGWMDVHSTPGKGTTIDFYIPAINAARPDPVEKPRGIR